MEHTSRALVLALALCLAVLITPGAAHDQPPRSESPPSFPIDLEKCWSSLFNVHGCVLELFQSVFSGKFGHVGTACCKAFSTIDANCWPHIERKLESFAAQNHPLEENRMHFRRPTLFLHHGSFMKVEVEYQ
ncbi:hypothetical protein Bca4012_078845 [Brassica carinata]